MTTNRDTAERRPDRFEPGPFERVLPPRERPQFSIAPVAVAWDAVAFRVSGERDGIACVPRAELTDFLDKLDAGALDEPIARFLASPASGRILRAASQTGGTGLFDEMASPGAIVPPERVPGRPRPFGIGGRGGSPVDARRRKRERGPGLPRRALVGAGVAVVVLAATAVAVASRSNDSSKRAAPAVPTTVTASPVQPPTASGLAVGDRCVVGRWRAATPISQTFTEDVTGEKVPVAGGIGATVEIQADGAFTTDWADSAPFRGNLANGVPVVYTLRGVERGRQTNRDGTEQDTADDVSQETLSGTQGAGPISNPHVSASPDATSSYTCDATGYTVGTTRWTRG